MNETYPLNSPDLVPINQNQEFLAQSHEITDVEALGNFLPGRISEALKSCEFQTTPELQEAVEGYYTDHYELAGAIKATVEGRLDSDLFDTILQDPRIQDWEREIGSKVPTNDAAGFDGIRSSPNAVTAAYRLAVMAKETVRVASVLSPEEMKAWHFRAIKQCGLALNNNLFKENSIGITTINEAEIKVAGELAAQLLQASGGRNIVENPSIRMGFPEPKDTMDRIRLAQENFWEDTRHAGQLEFHGTYNIGGINVYGLLSRNEQIRRTGSMTHATALNFDGGGKNMHSVVPHFSEFYGGGQYTGGERRGTVAVPLVKIIREAPYARDAQYGLLIPKPGSEAIKHVPLKTLERPLGQSGAGEADEASASGRDRVFFASADERGGKLPDEYKIPVHDKAEKPATYIIDRNGYEHSGRHELHDLGYGYGFPERLAIEPGDKGEGQIRALQQDYLDAYAMYGIVVPLRRGVFAQVFENVPVTQTLGRKTATIYNSYTHGSEKSSKYS